MHTLDSFSLWFRKEAVFSIPVGGSTMEEGKSGRMVISMEPVAVQAARV